jgi:hypothetical protein
MRANRGGASGGSSELEGAGGMSAPGAGSGQGSGGSGATRAPSGGGTQRDDADRLGSRTDRGNQNDEDVGSSASRGGGGGEINVPRSGNPGDPDPTPDTRSHFGLSGGIADNPDVTGTTDLEES